MGILPNCFFVVVVQLLIHVQLFATPWTTAYQASPSSTISQGLLRLIEHESVNPSNFLILCCPLLLLPLIFPSIRVFLNKTALHIRWPKYWSFSFPINPSNKHSGLISFRINCLINLLSKELKSLLQHHNSKASVLQCSAFFMVQLSRPYMTAGKTIALTMQTFVGKAISLSFNTLSRFVIAFLPRSKRLLISQPQSWSVVILEPKKIKSVSVSTFSSSRRKITNRVVEMGRGGLRYHPWSLTFSKFFFFYFGCTMGHVGY